MMGSKPVRIAGWVLSVLIVLLLGMSATFKFLEWEGKAKAFDEMGFTTDLMFKIGIVEAVIALLFLIPRTGFVGAILLTGYLGGATVTHLRVGQPFFMPIVIGVVIWVALGLRRPEVFSLAFGSKSPSAPTP